MRITTPPATPSITWFTPGTAGTTLETGPRSAAGTPARQDGAANRIAPRAPASAETDTAPARRNRFSVSRTAGHMPVFQPRTTPAAFAPANLVETRVEAGQRMGFRDLIDVINPLQHIPVVNTIYRRATGDDISPTAQFMGGMLFGGPLGAAAAMTDIAIRERTGTGVGDRVMNAMTDTETSNTPAVLAQRWTPRERMAGTQPVWEPENISKNNTMALAATMAAPQPAHATPKLAAGIPTHRLSPETGFGMLLNDLSTDTPNMS